MPKINSVPLRMFIGTNLILEFPLFPSPPFFFFSRNLAITFLLLLSLVNENLKKAHAQSTMHSYYTISTEAIKCNFKALALVRMWHSTAGMLPKYGCDFNI